MYNAAAVRPFLTRHNPAANPGAFFHGIPVDRQEAARTQGDYLFHATRLRNLTGILTDGLIANRGGQGGAGALLAPGQFQNDNGWVFASAIPNVVDCYAHEYDTHADNPQWETDWDNAPILLRFHQERADAFVPDTAHTGAVKTHNNISPHRLEMLTPDGWVVCDANARQDILNTLMDMGLGLL